MASASSSPASSCKKCPAFPMTGWSMPCAPRIWLAKISAIGPVTGSLSLNATSIGVVLAHSAFHAARLASAAWLSGPDPALRAVLRRRSRPGTARRRRRGRRRSSGDGSLPRRTARLGSRARLGWPHGNSTRSGASAGRRWAARCWPRRCGRSDPDALRQAEARSGRPSPGPRGSPAAGPARRTPARASTPPDGRMYGPRSGSVCPTGRNRPGPDK